MSARIFLQHLVQPSPNVFLASCFTTVHWYRTPYSQKKQNRLVWLNITGLCCVFQVHAIHFLFLLQVECADVDLSDAEKVYAECGQQCPLPWEKCILPQRMKQCVKIGEGTFGEVFTVINASGETVALKVCMLTCSNPMMPSVLWFLIQHILNDRMELKMVPNR